MLPALARAQPVRFFGSHAPPRLIRNAPVFQRPEKVPAWAAWEGPPPPPKVPSIRLPRAKPDPFESDHATIHVHLSGDGQVFVDRSQVAFGVDATVEALGLERGLRETDLDGLSSFLHRARALYGLACRRRKIASTFRSPDGSEWSVLNVLLHADRDAPWLHVQWTMMILAEQRLPRLWFGVANGRVRAHLPSLAPDGDERASLVVTVAASDPKQREWGPPDARSTVGVPTKVRYGFDGRTTTEPQELRAWIAAACAAAERPPVGRLRIAHRAPFDAVLAALSSLKSARIDGAVFLGNAVPGSGLRSRSGLPYPDSNEIGRLWDEGWDDD